SPSTESLDVWVSSPEFSRSSGDCPDFGTGAMFSVHPTRLLGPRRQASPGWSGPLSDSRREREDLVRGGDHDGGASWVSSRQVATHTAGGHPARRPYRNRALTERQQDRARSRS